MYPIFLKTNKLKTKDYHGFTVVEIMVAIAVIAILAVIAIVSYSSLNASARDDARKTHLAQIAKAFEAVYSTSGNFDTTCNGKKYGIPFVGSGATERVHLCYGQITETSGTGVAFLTAVGIKDTVEDPGKNNPYTYVYAPKTGEIEITAMMENPRSVSWISPAFADTVTYYVYSTLKKRSNIYGFIPAVVPTEGSVVDITNPSNLILTNMTTSTSSSSDGTPATPVLVSPTNGSGNVATGSVTFTWSPVSGATKYKLYVGTATGSWNINNGAVSLSTSLTTSILSANTTYYWTVEAWNGSLQGAKAGVWSFTTKGVVAPSYNVGNSLMFNGTNTYLNQPLTTQSASWIQTFSFWVKRSSLGSEQAIWSVQASGNYTWYSWLRFNADNTLGYYEYRNDSGLYHTSTSTMVFRDPSAWYHIMITQDAGSSRKIYVNGTQQTWSTSGSSGGYFWTFYVSPPNPNSGNYRIGYDQYTNTYFNGYLADVFRIDWQSLAPTTFGQFDSTTGQWIPKAYTGSYGTNGFHLDFSSGALTSGSNVGLGRDSSGNGNYWNTNNMTVAGNQMIDSPTNNFATWNPLANGWHQPTLSNGNLTSHSTTSNAASDSATTYASFAVSTGKWYWEIKDLNGATHSLGIGIGVVPQTGATYPSLEAHYLNYSGVFAKNGTSVQSGLGTTSAGDIIGLAFDAGSGTLTLYKSGSQMGITMTGLTIGQYAPMLHEPSSTDYYDAIANFWQWWQAWLQYCSDAGWYFRYCPPTGFKALSTANLPDPAIKNPKQYFDVLTYTGNGSNRTLTGLSFSPNLSWIKWRQGTQGHSLFDTIRWAGQYLRSNNTNSGVIDPTSLTAFTSDGFSLGSYSDVNTNNYGYVAWNWKEWIWTGPNGPGFDILSFSGSTGNPVTVGHSLWVTPKFAIFKNINVDSTHWGANYLPLGTGYLWLESTAQWISAASGISGTSTDITIGWGATNTGNSYIAYLWSEVPGFSKFGSYTGNGSATDGPFVYTGFKPRYVMIKRTDAAGNDWEIIDTVRDVYNVTDNLLLADAAQQEVKWTSYGFNVIDILSNGFKNRGNNGSFNASTSATYIYAAFAEAPFKYATAR